MDDPYDVPTDLWVSSGLELAVCLLAALAALAVLRRGPVAPLAALGALLAGGSAAFVLFSYRSTSEWTWSDRFYQLTMYGRAAGFALLALALVVGLLRSRRPGED